MPTHRRIKVPALAIAVLVAIGGVGVARSAERPPPRLSADRTPAAVDSSYGSGSFGRWMVDRFGLPAYRYQIDEDTAPQAAQPELGGLNDAWHQLGNDHIVANGYNHGYVQLWSQDRVYQWVNKYEPAARHYAGGYGYLNLGGRVLSTLYDDRPAGATTERDFGVGYARKRLTLPRAVDVEEFVSAPFGDDPVLLHDVRITNRSRSPMNASWFEYWDVNPVAQVWDRKRGTKQPRYDLGTRTLWVDQIPDDDDLDPLSIYASAVSAPVEGFDTDLRSFFGAGTRAEPEAVANDRATGSIAPLALPAQTGKSMFAFRSPVRVPAGRTVTLRYAYGAAHRRGLDGMLDRYRTGDPLRTSAVRWLGWLPRASFGARGAEWIARELQWDAYMVRSGTTYEEACGHHILSQGGYYQYGLGVQGAFRDQLGLSLSMISSEPEITREVIRYSAQEQEAVTGHAPYAMGHMCTPIPVPNADPDFWFLLAASEYVLATRDVGFLDERVRFVEGGGAPLWEHVKLAHRHVEQVVRRGPHGGYLVSATTGDWTDFSAQFMQMTESTFLTAQLAYTYPLLAQVAEMRGDAAFAAVLRREADELVSTLRREWTGRWFSRGYSLTRQLGSGALYEEPQPWALLAGAATPEQAATLLANVRRFLRGEGAPGGPSLIGSAQSPSREDPEVTERTPALFQEAGALGSYGGGNAVFLGGVWYALNGPLLWAFGEQSDRVPGASAFAWEEYLRNTLAWHATAFPDHWDSVISVDDVCWAWYSKDAARCGDEVLAPQYRYAGQILNKHAWWLWGIQRLAGISPDGAGYTISPRFPFQRFSLRLPGVGLAVERGRMRGYVRPEAGGALLMRVRLPRGTDPSKITVWIGARRARARLAGGVAIFELPTRAGAPADWAITWS